jgi:hypothetical protein
MDDQSTCRDGSGSVRRFRLSLRLAMLLMALFAVLSAWIGVERQAKREQLRIDIRGLEISRRQLDHQINEPQVQYLVNDPQFGYGPQLRKAIAETDKAIEAAKQKLNSNK